MSEYILSQEIISLSVASNWSQSKSEWFLYEIYMTEEPDTCLCGHFPIKEICIIKNKLNSNTATVGNVCVKKFMGLPSDKIFQAVRRVQNDNSKSFNKESVKHAYKKNWINEWEYNFSLDILRKRKLSNKQTNKKRQINVKILSKILNTRKKK